MPFEEPRVLATFDRSFGDKGEELRLEQGEFQGKPTFSLRIYWKTPEGQWRWAAQKPTQSGKCWERLNLKQRELQKLGEALLQAAGSLPANDTRRQRSAPTPFADVDSDDIPF